MASAVITSRNESSWGQSMGKLPYSNLKNPNPKKQKFTTVNGGQTEDLPAVTQTTSDDAYSFNQRSNNHHNGFNHGAYITFNVASCTKRDLNELKKRLAEELDKIRKLNYQIESGQFQPGSNSKLKKKVLGTKRPVQCDGNQDGLMKMCKQVLMKLMKHKFSWIFNKPVDAKALGLHDYHSIIKQPMDLGTVKANLGKGLYVTPVDFAEDVRLTFNNALLYNPRTDEVHSMAEQLLGVFEDMVRPIVERTGGERREQDCGFVGDHIPAQDGNAKQKTKSSPKPPISKKKERIQSGSSASNPPPLNPVAAAGAAATPMVHSPVVPMTSPMRATTPVKSVGVRGVLTKQPKPRAKDLNKREMSMEEKQKLGIGLQSLPQEKMPQLVQIIRKRNAHLAEEDDEIELDIEALDKETLWELDRFVTNWKKLVSKTKRQALMVNNSAGENTITAAAEAESDRDGTSDLVKKQKKGEGGDEDVDIDDDMPVTSFPPVEIEKDEGGHDQNHGDASNSSSGSSSSSSGSSSSSDSDSGSSSGSDSDADDEQCRK